MKRIILSAQAESDIVEIGTYIAAHHHAGAARWIDRLDDALNKLAQHPELGRPRDELAPKMRSMNIGVYVIFYTVSARAINIVRVLHGMRDINSLLP